MPLAGVENYSPCYNPVRLQLLLCVCVCVAKSLKFDEKP